MNTTTADAATSTFTLPENVGLTVPPPPLEGAALNPVPGWMDVLREQLASVGLALRREAMMVAGFATLITGLVVTSELQNGGGGIPLTPTEGIAAVVAALLIPLAVWKGEDPSRRGYHHAMPVDQGAHAVARGVAGLAWTMAAVAAFFGWMGLLSVATGGSVEAAVEPWQWAAPFAGAMVTYLLGSALTLVTSHTWRWLGGGLVGYLMLNTAFRVIDAARPLIDGINALLTGDYGLKTVLTGLVANEYFHPRSAALVPDAGAWLTATFLWLAAAISLFLWAAYRQPER